MPYGRQITEEGERENRRLEVSEGEARRQEGEVLFEEPEQLSG